MKGFFGPASWETRLRQLHIDPDRISARDLETINNYFRRNIKSDLQPQQTIAALKNLYENYERIKNKTTLDEIVDSDSSLTAFSYAAKNGMDRFLIQAWSHSSEEVKEACLQHLSSFKNSALHLAAIYGHLPVIRLLLQLKMTAIQANEAGKLPIMLSLQSHKQNNRKQCYQELLAASEPQVYEQQDTSGENIVFYLIRAQMENESLEVLQRNPSALGTFNKTGESLLHAALLAGQKKIYQTLLKNKALLAHKTINNQSILHYAVASGNEEAVKAVLDCQPDWHEFINGQDKKQNTPLHMAAAQNHTGIIELLLAKGARTDIRNERNKLAADLAPRDSRDLLLNRTPGMGIH